MSDDWEMKREALENLILLVLGAVPDHEISMLHLEKEVFLLWNFYPDIQEFIRFIAYFRGPFSEEIADAIKNPYFLTDSWEYHKPVNNDKISGGSVSLTGDGYRLYQDLYSDMLENDEVRPLLSGIKIVRTVYDGLSLEELLLLIYDTYPDYRIKSEVAKEIYDKREYLAKKLLKKGIISESRSKNLEGAKWYS